MPYDIGRSLRNAFYSGYQRTPCVIIQSLEAILDHGADVNLCYPELYSCTPLSAQIKRQKNQNPNNLSVIQYLVDNDADVNAANRDGSTPLSICIKYTYTVVAQYLLKIGANVCKPAENGKTPLSLAVIWKTANNEDMEEMIHLLLDNGAQHNIQTALLDAIECKKLNIVNLLISRGAKVNYKHKNEYTPLIKSITLNQTAIVEELMNHNADPNLLDSKGTSPLIKAIETRIFPIFKSLVEHGADVNLSDKDGNVPLIKSIEFRKIAMARALVDRRADLDVIGPCGRTPLTKSIETDNIQMTKYLVESGADVNKFDGKNETPLVVAAKKCDVYTFEFLVDSGAKVELVREQIEAVADVDDNFSVFFEAWKETRSRNARSNLIRNLMEECGHEEA